jgi:hypothetical protein
MIFFSYVTVNLDLNVEIKGDQVFLVIQGSYIFTIPDFLALLIFTISCYMKFFSCVGDLQIVKASHTRTSLL